MNTSNDSDSSNSSNRNKKGECVICVDKQTIKRDLTGRIARYYNRCNDCKNYYCVNHGKKINNVRTCDDCL